MVTKNPWSNLSSWVFFLICSFSYMLSPELVNGRNVSDLIKHKKEHIIEVEDGDIIECVDIYKQPAFTHPLLKYHKIQMRPSSNPSGIIRRNNTIPFQHWNMKGKCPKGTIPIVRTQAFNHKKASPILPNTSLAFTSSHEYAQVSARGGEYFGAHATFGLWNPRTNAGEFSIAQVWLVAGPEDDMNTIEAGWQAKDGEKESRLFTYWTRDNYQHTGCYNLECPGFVQTSHRFGVGSAMKPVSVYGDKGKQYEIDIDIHKDTKSGNWWLQVQGENMGYWPSTIFTSLAKSSTLINWGGEIVNLRSNGHHTNTQMGSGHFPNEGFSKACRIRNLRYVDGLGVSRDADELITYVTNPSCYDLHIESKRNDFGVNLYFGGPGNSPQCP
ncbi:hypothetical protein JCGZ_20857 [Jatropha curcas]|uniref:Neprosin PEP catalytic domain-containing protein n=2 Tax=Jatropha curcas TaxID=180498 RepID=A0A067L613_JATCU|nr:hypothetical protein JCGZ_20857 [Jatropha curcas]